MDHAARLQDWTSHLARFSLPEWDRLPELELYMDQVVLLVGNYLTAEDLMPGSDRPITASIVNNYVRMKIIPPPTKKRYNRVHLAYLLVICSLKQSLSIASIQKLMPLGLSESEVQEVYTRFVKQNRIAANTFLRYVKAELPDGVSLDTLPICTATIAGLAKSLTEHLLYTGEPPAKQKK